MNRLIHCVVALLFAMLMHTSILIAQETGHLTGVVVDDATGETLIGANVLVVGTSLGAATGVNGSYAIRKIPAGEHDIRVSLLGYTSKLVSKALIQEGETLTLNVGLGAQAISVDEVVVTADAVLSSESAVIAERQRARSIGDGIGAEQIKRTADATSAEVLKRIPSVSIVDNKFLVVRGTSERYNSAMLNNTSVASGEPEKKSFAFDLFPTNLIETTVLTKSFTPDLPGDFSGGLLRINTVDFPTEFMLSLNGSRGYLNATSGSSFKTYPGGSKDRWGVDDGTRGLPASFPADLTKGTRTASELTSIAQSLSNNWSTRSVIAPTNSNYSLSLGDRYSIADQVVGFIFSASYRDSYENADIVRNEYESNDVPRFAYSGAASKYSVLWGGLANLSIRIFENHKISSKNTFNRASEDEVIDLSGIDNDGGTEIKQSALRFVTRSISSTQLFGEHAFPKLGATMLEWKLFRSISSREEPDYRRIIYAREIGSTDPYYAMIGGQVNLKNGGRYFSDLSDDARGAGIDLSHSVGVVRLKAGGAFDEKSRDFSSRLIGVVANASGNGFTDSYLYFLPMDSIFAPENFRRNGFSIQEYASGFNRYAAGQRVRAAYGMVEVPLSEYHIRVVAGLRLEQSLQTVRTRNLTGTTPVNIQKDYEDILPSINIIYSPWGWSNVRVAYSQTINRPELRELSPFPYYDFNTQTTLYGNGGLNRALVRNYDVRFEAFPGIGELVSVSLFYKSFTDAIEQIVNPGSALGAERTFRNAEMAKNYGVEIEARRSLGFLGSAFSNFSINTNYSWIRSRVELPDGRSRPLQGQSNYTLNVGLLFADPELGTSLNLLYNRFGERLSEAATSYQGDVVEAARDLLDVTLTQQVWTMFEVKVAARDLLHQEQRFMQGEKVSRSNSRAASYSIGLGFRY